MNRGGMVVVTLAAALTGCGGSADEREVAVASSAPTTTTTVDRTQERLDKAYEVCVGQITEQLRAPATARFSERGDNSEGADGDRRFLFTGTVDSENGFGALLRSDFACEIRWSPSAGFVADQAIVTDG